MIAFLDAPASHGATEPVVRIETHISLVFLAGDRAFKLKRAVKFPYVDYSTVQNRLDDCDKEIALNRLTAPHLYLGVRRITREADGHLAFDGAGEIVDAVVEMVRFDQDDLFDQMAIEGRLTRDLMVELAREVAEFHDVAQVVHTGGGADNIAGVLDINRAGFATSHVFSDREVDAFDARFRAALETVGPELDARETDGKVRRCHGDLHLRNICLVADKPLIFDCIEFNDQIATIDVLYDLAFLLMDLWHRELFTCANLVINRYLDLTGDDADLWIVHFFMALRAAVRAHVTATQAEGAARGHDDLAVLARDYFHMALDLLKTEGGILIVLGGLSGTGKSSVAEALAPHLRPAPGARLLESDLIRKSLFGVSPETRLPQSAYTRTVSDQVYAQLGTRAVALSKHGIPVIADAVFSHPGRRAKLEAEAKAAGVTVYGFWLDAPAEILRARVESRQGGPSDAGRVILEIQLERDPGDIAWTRIDANRPVEEIVLDIADRIGHGTDINKG